MAKRIPFDAFEVYFAMGPARSYAEVARHYGVSKRAILKRATSERWQQRIEEREAKVRSAVENRVDETVAELRARHGKILKAITGKAIEALKKLPLASAMDAVRALDLVLKQERLLYGLSSSECATVQVQVQTQVPSVGPPLPTGETLRAYMLRLFEVSRDLGITCGDDLESIVSSKDRKQKY